MRTAPSQAYLDAIVGSNRNVNFRVMFSIDGVLTDISNNVKNIDANRTSGESTVASFTAALATEVTITLATATLDLGAMPVAKKVTLEIGFDGEYMQVFSGSCQKVVRSVSSRTTVITCLDFALSLTRTQVTTPTYRSIPSAVYIRELLELAGVTSRAGSPDQLMFALDFDSESLTAITSSRKAVSDTSDNGMNESVVNPDEWYGFPNYAFVDSNRSGALLVDPFTITNNSETVYYPDDQLINPKRILVAANAEGRCGISSPDGYGGGAASMPSVVHIAGGKWGYEYYGTFQPLPSQSMSSTDQAIWKSNKLSRQLTEAMFQGLKGSPCVYASANGQSWDVPVGALPLGGLPTYSKNTKVKYRDNKNKVRSHTLNKGETKIGYFNCEATLYYGGGNLYVIWRQVQKSTEAWYYRYWNGATWSAAVKWKAFPYGTHTCPSFALGTDGKIHIWWVDRNTNPNRVWHDTCTSIGGSVDWNGHVQCSLPDIKDSKKDVWRISPIVDPVSNVGWAAAVSYCDTNTNLKSPGVVIASSSDAINWRSGNDVIRRSISWDNKDIVGACLIPNKDDTSGQAFTMWYAGRDAGNGYGVGKTDVFRDLIAIATTKPDGTAFGPTLYGEVDVNMAIDGVTPVKNFATDANAAYLTFGGWFKVGGGNSCLVMEVNFGIDCKFIIGKSGGNVIAKMYRYAAGAWSQKLSCSGAIADWTQEHFITLEVRTTKAGAKPVGTLQLRCDGAVVATSASSLVTDTTFDRIGSMSSVVLCSSYSASVHNANFSNDFPGMTYDNLFVSQASAPSSVPQPQYQLDKGLNWLNVAAFNGTNPWSEMKDVCEAEMASISYDDKGVFHFHNRLHYSQNSNTVVKDVTPVTNMKNISVSQDIADVRNRIRVVVKSQKLKNATDIWNLDAQMVVPANSSVSYEIDTGGCVDSCDTIMSSTSLAGSSRYRAAYVVGYINDEAWIHPNGKDGSQGGAETALRFNIVPRGRVLMVTVTNVTATDVVLVDGNGNNFFYIWGRTYTDPRYSAAEGIVVTKEDVASQDLYGTNEVEISLPWMVDYDSAVSFCSYMLARYKDGLIRVKDLDIIGDPMLEVGDKISVVFDPLGVNGEFWIEAIDDALSPDAGYTQTVTVSVADAGEWN